MCIIALAAIVGGAKAQTDGGFSAFYKQQQTRLLQHIDNNLGKKAKDTLTRNFTFVRNAGVHLQSGLGGRKSGAGVDLVGAFSATDNRAVGWQLRGYVNEDDIKGANVGLFFRQSEGNVLYGVNTFADYEDGKYGAFSRYGFGGEFQSAFFAVNANYYKPISDDKKINATVAAFSREGYDANLRLYLPQYNFLKLRGDYYNYDGKGKTKKDEGFRYGLELSPITPVRFALYYDDDTKKVGGDIAIHFPFDKTQPQQNNNTTYTPNLFAPIQREYSQRIATVAVITTAPPTMTMPTTTTMTTTLSPMTMTTFTTLMVATTTEVGRIGNAHFVFADQTSFFEARVDLSTRVKWQVTLPPVAVMRPHVLTIMRRFTGNTHRVLTSSTPLLNAGTNFLPSGRGPWTITIVEGSEEVQSTLYTTTTMTTTMTAFQTITSFVTTTLTQTQNAEANTDTKMPSIPPPPTMPQMPLRDIKIAMSPPPQIKALKGRPKTNPNNFRNHLFRSPLQGFNY